MRRDFDAKIRKVGNSLVVTVPALTVERFKLKENQLLGIQINSKKYTAKLRKVGNSFVVTVSASLVKKFELKESQFITVGVEFEDK